MSRDGVLPAVAVAAICAMFAPYAPGTISFQWLPHEIHSVSAISGDGTTVLAYVSGAPMLWHVDQGFLPVPVDVPAGYRLNVMSSDASVFGGYAQPITGQDPAWIGNGNTNHATSIGPVVVGPTGEYRTWIRDIADNGAVVGFSTEAADAGEQPMAHAFRWTAAEGFEPLQGLAENVSTLAYGISADGSLMVGASDGRPVRWLSDGAVEILFDRNARAVDISADGSVIAGLIFGVSEPHFGMAFDVFVWSEAEGLNVLTPPLGQFNLEVTAISGDGSTIVGFGHRINGDITENRAFVWSAQLGMRDLNHLLAAAGIDMQGVILAIAVDVSYDGRTIVGHGYGDAWMITIPEPGLAVWLVTGGSLALLRRRT